MLKSGKIEPREYQKAIAQSVLEKGNSLVVLPTGLGKTIVALLVLEKFLSQGKRALVLAPTRPLTEQHRKKILECTVLEEGDVALLTGETPAEKRKAVWESARVVAATPQTAENDLRGGRMKIEEFGMVVFDEAHRAVGDYAYTSLAGECWRKGVLVLGLTASPGGDAKKINEIVDALGVKNLEIRTDSDEDVAKYIKPLEATWVNVSLPAEMAVLQEEMKALVRENVAKLAKMGYVSGNRKSLGKKEMLELRARMLREKSGRKYSGMSVLTQLLNLTLALELLETQSVYAFREFFRKMGERQEKSRAVENILADRRVQEMLRKAEEIATDHPKMNELLKIVGARSLQGKTLIVFVQYRDQVRRIVEKLKEAPGVKAAQFVGKRDGFSEKEQRETIQKFREGAFNVLVASSIGEEGLDIPSVDCVVFYEPIPSEIRSIQRRGRAGRAKAGEVIVLITRNTRDETYYWSARKKEGKMKAIVKGLQKKFSGTPAQEKKVKKGQASLEDFF